MLDFMVETGTYIFNTTFLMCNSLLSSVSVTT